MAKFLNSNDHRRTNERPIGISEGRFQKTNILFQFLIDDDVADGSSVFLVRCEWPSVTRTWNKSRPNFALSCPKLNTEDFTQVWYFFKIFQIVAIHWATFAWNFVSKNFKKSPNRAALDLWPTRFSDFIQHNTHPNNVVLYLFRLLRLNR